DLLTVLLYSVICKVYMPMCKAFIERFVPAFPPLHVMTGLFVADISAGMTQQSREVAVQGWRINSILVCYFSAFFWRNHFQTFTTFLYEFFINAALRC